MSFSGSSENLGVISYYTLTSSEYKEKKIQIENRQMYSLNFRDVLIYGKNIKIVPRRLCAHASICGEKKTTKKKNITRAIFIAPLEPRRRRSARHSTTHLAFS